MRFTFYQQLNTMDCGPTCLRMIAKYYGRHYNTDTLRKIAGFNREGVSLLAISEAAEKLGFRTRGVQVNLNKLRLVPQPSVLHWNQNHFVVLLHIGKKHVKIADPRVGIIKLSIPEFLKNWTSNSQGGEDTGTVLLLEPSPSFYENEGEKDRKLHWGTIASYLSPNKARLAQVLVSLLVGALLQLILPFLTQSLVDTGINTKNLQYITLVLIAQLTLTFSSVLIGFIRSRLQMRISNGINIAILSDFWIKVTRLPLSYFETHKVGDTMQRINDNRQIQSFLTGQAVTFIFSIIMFFVYAVILILYNPQIFFVFAIGNLAYFGWIRIFLSIRRRLNYETFHISSQENNATLQLMQGMTEIRLNNAEQLRRWEWENVQVKIFRLQFKSLNYSQWQNTGALMINQGKDIIISFMVAQLVVSGSLTLGAMLAVQYIIGQLSGPVEQFINLVQNYQDSKISMERLNEIHSMADEEPREKTFVTELPENKTIRVENLSFRYPGAGNEPVLDNVSFNIPEGKVTAIVGASGSGKTTILKLLLKLYEDYDGEIEVGDANFRYISPSYWRSTCGTVMQDGFMFNDTVARNIAVGVEDIDHKNLIRSCRVANILPFIDSLPNGFNTQLGADGTGISKGQHQRLLIARAIYKDPHYLLFDEATNSLDANNEKIITENLNDFFAGRTVVVVAHRLSTVQNADNIIVLEDGKIAEEGNHYQLSMMKGRYYELVKNQLELGD
ncbi:peptidase domain-containing ABC transporter [Chitinophaga rhizosphaerae]|uniref:peptidase domain-containing ABC transporter n=1 Tax=Chitinophaga rhizosphaerae TaxID=1864947 RepID=UPI000F80A3F2|nr:peptidase domain-containing ABC transporter [Chitinophaga rhizosphaerae]